MTEPDVGINGLEETPLLNLLARYAERGGERWHTPGHKGRRPRGGDFLKWEYDITEIEEILRAPHVVEQSQQLMAKSYGADQTWYSVAGATLPVVAGILAAFPFGATLYADRNLHRCALSALLMAGYHVRWLYSTVLEAGLVLPLREFPEDFSGAAGLVVTRPTYDGLAAPLESVIASAHDQGLAVVVDEAHGSHWQGAEYPFSAIGLGADLTAHGVHKSEASLTQTGLLHLKGSRVSPWQVERWWRMLQTSSPSYLLLASLDRLQWERRRGRLAEDWRHLAGEARQLWEALEQRGVAVLQKWAEGQGFAVDPARLTLLGDGADFRKRLSRFGEVEKTTPGSCTLLLAPGQKLAEISRAFENSRPASGSLVELPYPVLPTVMSVREAWEREGRWVPLGEAAGCIVKEALTPYPPGVPLAVPGELLEEHVLEWIWRWIKTEPGPLEGLRYQEGRPMVWVVK